MATSASLVEEKVIHLHIQFVNSSVNNIINSLEGGYGPNNWNFCKGRSRYGYYERCTYHCIPCLFLYLQMQLIVDFTGIYKADIGIKDGLIHKIGIVLV